MCLWYVYKALVALAWQGALGVVAALGGHIPRHIRIPVLIGTRAVQQHVTDKVLQLTAVARGSAAARRQSGGLQRILAATLAPVQLQLTPFPGPTDCSSGSSALTRSSMSSAERTRAHETRPKCGRAASLVSETRSPDKGVAMVGNEGASVWQN